MANWSPAAVGKFLFCVAAVYSTFIYWGVLQEKITAEGYLDSAGKKHVFKQVAVMNFLQALVGAAIGFLGLLFVKQHPDAPLSAFKTVGFTTAVASPIGYQSLAYVDYPLYALAKSCKMVPVMLWSVILNKKKYTLTEYASVLLITLGVCLFSFKMKGELSKSFLSTLVGLVFIFANLLVDGYTCAQQDKMKAESRSPIPSVQSLAFLNVWVLVTLAAYLGADHVLGPVLHPHLYPDAAPHVSTLTQALSFYLQFPTVLWDILLFSLMGSVGQLVILYNIREFGSLVNTIITVTRKFLTIIVSVVVYNHPMTTNKWVGAGLVFAGLGLEAYNSYTKKDKKH